MSADWRPWFAGCASGSLLTLVGHPFDTAKVRMQADAKRWGGPWQCVRMTVAQEGAMALYKGLVPALLTSCVTSGLRFGVQHRFNSWLGARLAAGGGGGAPADAKGAFARLPLHSRVLAEGGGGAACGLVLPLVFTPMELVKVKRQVMRGDRLSNVSIARQVFREGGLRGLYTGYGLTVVRSTAGNAVMFGSYELFRAGFVALGWAEEATSGHMLAGALAGSTAWLATFPVDAAKSRQQLQVGGGAPLSAAAALRQLWREGTLYRGMSPILLRSMPVHLVYLPSYSLIMKCLAAPNEETLEE